MIDNNPSPDQMQQWQNDPDNWKAGFIYYNKKDSRVFVPKRVPLLGFTINFGHRNSTAIIIGLCLLIAVLVTLTTHH